jgi:hypothetical protein
MTTLRFSAPPIWLPRFDQYIFRKIRHVSDGGIYSLLLALVFPKRFKDPRFHFALVCAAIGN